MASMTATCSISASTSNLFDQPLGNFASCKPHLKRLEALGLHCFRDVLFHLPRQLIYRPLLNDLQDVPSGTTCALKVKIISHHPSLSRGRPFRIEALCGETPVDLCFFHMAPYFKRSLLPGTEWLVAGTLEVYMGRAQIIHPDKIQRPTLPWDPYEVIYPSALHLSQHTLRKIVMEILKILKTHDQALYKVFYQLHHPKSAEDLSPLCPHREKLAYDELLAHQLSLLLFRKAQEKTAGQAFLNSGALEQQVIQSLPFALTPYQQEALKEIHQDLASPWAMLRLLQGDVGSGKTLVALLSSLAAIESGAQVAWLAPTEILATQHYKVLEHYLGNHVSCALLLSSTRKKAKLYDDLKEGKISFVVGTHALLEDTVTFKNLGYVVIDEQHRFGVDQRHKLLQKGEGVNVLIMSATPIPRTLQLAKFGDLSFSTLQGKPQNRRPIDTYVLSAQKIPDLVHSLKEELSKGEKAYWVCPLIEESEKMDLVAAQDRYNSLEKAFPGTVGLIHGRMKQEEKDRIFADFKAGNISLLVATTVIEVGVDVPDATLMIIEHAERFGLSQLHQLRGRVGRSDLPSRCLLIYGQPLSAIAKERLKMMKESEDGFKIAEADLRLRGAGETLGTRQSGQQLFHVADLTVHGSLLEKAYEDAKNLAHDPQNPKIQQLFSLFGKKTDLTSA